MATRWKDFGNGTYAHLSGSNVGVIAREGEALVIDAGLDKDAARRVLRALEGLEARPAAILITHGHADHFGGAEWLAERAEIPIYAPPLEAAFVAYPFLEPLFLNGGATPIEALRSKFTLAKRGGTVAGLLTAGKTTIAGFDLEILHLPGHAPRQVGIASGATLYCGDALFPQETLDRHPILFCHDLDAWLETLERLPPLAYANVIPGHGEPVTDVAPLAKANTQRLREIRSLTLESLTTPKEPGEVLHAVAAHYGVKFAAPQFYLLSLTTIHAALTSLQRSGDAEVFMEDNCMLWRRT